MLTDQTDGLGVALLCNGAGVDTYGPARYALQVAAAIRDGLRMPEPPPLPDATRIDNASRYAGDYADAATGARLSLRAAGGGLRLTAGGCSGLLEHIAGDAFCVPWDAFDPFPLRFRAGGRDDDAVMTEAHHGAAVYLREGSAPAASAAAAYPEWWAALPGHYRSMLRMCPTFMSYCGGPALPGLAPRRRGSTDPEGTGHSRSGRFAWGRRAADGGTLAL